MSEPTQRSAAQDGAEPSTTQETPDTRSPEEIQADIEETRQDLGESLEALSGKLDVKSRAREQAQQARTRAQEQAQQARTRAQEQARVAQVRVKEVQREHGQQIAIGAAVTVALVVTVMAWRRWRR